ncbi:hypothetical protein BASA81_010749 [Batrachochytrium salamandrivorans]|nr:hypothetical protein BASA81_010749 [Batrachochytrium salamandrivorans]
MQARLALASLPLQLRALTELHVFQINFQKLFRHTHKMQAELVRSPSSPASVVQKKPKIMVKKEEEEVFEDAAAEPKQASTEFRLEVGNKRFVTVSQFKKQTLVQIREYYEDKDGELKPGKRGIALKVSEFDALKSLLPQIEQEIKRLQ